MPPNIAPFLPSPQQLDEAAAAAKKLALIASASAAALYLAPKFPVTTSKVTGFVTGFEIKPGVGIKVTPLALLWFAPQPVGVVPPSVTGTPPELANPKTYARAIGLFGGREELRRQVQQRLTDDHERLLRLYRSSAQIFGDDAIEARINQLQSEPLTGLRSGGGAGRGDVGLSDIDQLVILVAERDARARFRGTLPPIQFIEDLRPVRPVVGEIGPELPVEVQGAYRFTDIDPSLLPLDSALRGIASLDQLFASNPPDP